jgi:hypothetical protein
MDKCHKINFLGLAQALSLLINPKHAKRPSLDIPLIPQIITLINQRL